MCIYFHFTKVSVYKMSIGWSEIPQSHVHVLGVSLVFDFAPFCCFLFSKCQKCSAVEFKLSFSVCHEAISVAFWCLSGILICVTFYFVIL